jgi:hypothetical protein
VPEVEDFAEADLALLAALTLALALALEALASLSLAAAVGVARAIKISLPYQIVPQLALLTATSVFDDRESILTQAGRPASQITLSTLRSGRGHQNSRVAETLVTAQASRLREEGARRAGRPENAVRARAALRKGARGRERCGEVAGARVRNYNAVALTSDFMIKHRVDGDL